MEITVIGAGCAGRAFLQELRKLNQDIPVTLIDKTKNYYPRKDYLNIFDREYRINMEDNLTFAKELSLNFIEAKVERVNPNRKKIYLKDNQSLDYDKLVIATGLVSKPLGIKGENKEGVFYLSSFSPYTLRDFIKIASEVIIFSHTFLGILISLSLRITKEVKLVTDTWEFLDEYRDRVKELLNREGIDVYPECKIEEIIGNGEVKAARLSLPKIISSQLIIIDSGFIPNLSFISSWDFKIKNNLFTNYSDIYVIGDVANPYIEKDFFCLNNSGEAKQQAQLLAHYLLERREFIYEYPSLSLAQYNEYIKVFLRNANVKYLT